MRYAAIVFLSTWMIASVAIAQKLPAPTSDNSDSWAKPATTSSVVSYRDSGAPVDKPSPSSFKFKTDDRFHPADQPPPSAMDKASVMGTDRPWQNGRPPVDCAMTPHDAACQR